MSGDYSRISFDPRQHDLGVLLQQGRPLSDADWNALVAQLRHRLHAGSLDTFGPAVVPMQTPDAFRIGFSGGNLEIGRGRIYVDGMLVENHGTGAATWDPRLEQVLGALPALYDDPAAGQPRQQPYYPNPPAVPTSGRHMVYLDVWQREVTHVMRPDLVDPAVGVDSTTRLQTVWQVKLLPNVGSDLSCASSLDQIPALAPSAGRLSTTTADVPGQPDPCLVPPDGGYKGLENQLYRVEIHTPGPAGTATFKWSRENASVETRVTHLPALDQLVVESTGRDAVLGFHPGDWVEVTDDWRELHGLPGQLRRVRAPDGVDDAARTLRLETPLSAGLFPTGPEAKTHPERNTRVKRWDHRGIVRNQAGAELQDLDSAASNGEITVPAAATSVLLEHGIIATFSLAPAGGEFRSGDYWVFCARTGEGEIEELDAAPPRGIHHHYAKLGFVSLPSTFEDCRVFWPPPAAQGGGDHCACTVCVTPQQHAANQPSIQAAIDQVIAAGGGTVCLEVGDYVLREPLRIRNAKSLRVTGKGNATSLRADQAVFEPIIGSTQVTLERFEAKSEGKTGAIISIMDSAQVTLESLRVVAKGEAAAVGLSGALFELSIRGNDIQTQRGIVASGSSDQGTSLADLRIDDNLFDCRESAIVLPDVTVHQFVSRIAGNHFTDCRDGAIQLTGAAAPGFGVEVTGNSLSVLGDGIRAGIDGLRIAGNQLAVAKAGDEGRVGILLVEGIGSKDGLDDCHVVDNRIVGFGLGIVFKTAIANSLVRGNQIEGAELGLACAETTVQQLSIDQNQFTVGKGGAIRIEAHALGPGASIAATGNQIHAEASDQAAVAIQMVRGDCQYSGNHCVQPVGGKDGCVHLVASTLIVASNRVLGGRGLSMHLVPDETLVNEKPFPSCTVLGNITAALIQVRGAPLDAPWKPLNLQNTP
jgi:hypothetical protein